MRKMSSNIPWILILLCTLNFLTAIAHQDSEILRSKELLISSEEISFAKIDNNDHARKLTAPSEEISLTGKGQKGKGAYGGANVVHRRPGDKSSAELYKPSCFFILSAIFNLALSSFFFRFSSW